MAAYKKIPKKVLRRLEAETLRMMDEQAKKNAAQAKQQKQTK